MVSFKRGVTSMGILQLRHVPKAYLLEEAKVDRVLCSAWEHALFAAKQVLGTTVKLSGIRPRGQGCPGPELGNNALTPRKALYRQKRKTFCGLLRLFVFAHYRFSTDWSSSERSCAIIIVLVPSTIYCTDLYICFSFVCLCISWSRSSLIGIQTRNHDNSIISLFHHRPQTSMLQARSGQSDPLGNCCPMSMVVSHAHCSRG